MCTPLEKGFYFGFIAGIVTTILSLYVVVFLFIDGLGL